MRPAKIFAAVLVTAAVVATGAYLAHATATHPVAAAPTVPVAIAPTTSTPTAPTLIAKPSPQPPDSAPDVPIDRVPAPRPALADSRYDAYIRTVDLGRNQVVVDLIQVFHDDAATQAAIADGKPRDAAQGLNTYIRNHNPRLRTLPLARDLQVDVLRGNETADGCGGPSLIHKLNMLISDVSFHSPNLYFTLTVNGGAVHHIKEVATQPAC
jgi:hypothetical protein